MYPHPSTVAAPNAEALMQRLSDDLEHTIALAETCRWFAPGETRAAEQLVADAMALFARTMQQIR